MREPSPWLAQLIGIPIGAIAAAIIAILWFVLTPLRDARPTLSYPTMLLALVVITIVHELSHAIVHPKAGCSSHTVLGFWPAKIVFYAHYDGELTRNRFVAILLMPLFVISIMPLVLAALVGASSGWLAFASSLNAFMACVDILGAGMLLFQIPATAIVRNQGWRTYWTEHVTLDAT